MKIQPRLRFPLIVGGILASICLAFWPFVRGARQEAKRAGIT
jgi:hypothetical protein